MINKHFITLLNYCDVEMSNKDNDILKYNHGEKSMKVSFTIYADLESLLEKMSTCHNTKESSAAKINKLFIVYASSYSLLTHCSFDNTKNNLDYNRDQDYMKNFSRDLEEHAAKIINYEKMIPLSIEDDE